MELQGAKLGKVAQRSRQRAFQTVVAQPDGCDPACAVGDDSVPFVYGLVAHPVVVPRSVRTARGIVQRHECLAIGCMDQRANSGFPNAPRSFEAFGIHHEYCDHCWSKQWESLGIAYRRDPFTVTDHRCGPCG